MGVWLAWSVLGQALRLAAMAGWPILIYDILIINKWLRHIGLREEPA
jgi:hypothetical protein